MEVGDHPQKILLNSQEKNVSSLVVEPTPLKNMLVKLEIFPNFRDENKTYLSCHHLGFLVQQCFAVFVEGAAQG